MRLASCLTAVLVAVILAGGAVLCTRIWAESRKHTAESQRYQIVSNNGELPMGLLLDRRTGDVALVTWKHRVPLAVGEWPENSPNEAAARRRYPQLFPEPAER